MARTVVLLVALAFIAGFAFLTLYAIVEGGFTAASAIAILVLALLATGIIGSLRNPPKQP